MLSQKQFELLISILKEPLQSQRYYATALGFSLGSLNEELKELTEASLVIDGNITESGLLALQPYKVENAVIMAAGLSSRMAPLSLETPKGLLLVKGEVLIERQIRQLHEVSITDITIVLGYRKEKFFYLEEKYGVKILVNENYYRYGTASTLIVAKEELKNTYICQSDNYFIDNIFEQYAYQPFYASIYIPHKVTSLEYAASFNKQGLIKNMTIGDENFWCLYAHTYFTRDFSRKYIDILKTESENSIMRAENWEFVYLKHINELDLYIKKYSPNIIYEFDSLNDLKAFDPYYIDNADFDFLRHIILTFNCSKNDITQIEPIKNSENPVFSFELFGKKYIYQYPDRNRISNFALEKQAIAHAKKLGLYESFVFFDEKEGWTIRHYLDDAKKVDYFNEKDLVAAISVLKKLHSANIDFKTDFNIWGKITDLILHLQKTGKTKFIGFDEIFSAMSKLYKRVQQDNMPSCFCHCASFASNFMINKDEIELMNWDSASLTDPAFDLGTFICHSHYTRDEILHVLQLYYGRELSQKELRHCIAYVALSAYFWFINDLHADTLGNYVGESLYRNYTYAKKYLQEALELYEY